MFYKDITRRDFLRGSATVAVAALYGTSLPQTAIRAESLAQSQRLLNGWEFYPGGLGGPWDAWRPDKGLDLSWQNVEMPHCFNALDCVDPDHSYYQGPGWYRVTLKPVNPFANGRTLLHFEGAGQKTEVFIYLDQVGRHVGGYDEFTIDITDAAQKAQAISSNHGSVPLAVMCDNSRDLEMIPSSLNDFTRHGGLYRYVNLTYVPVISLKQVHIDPIVNRGGASRACVRATLYNPTLLRDEVEISVRLFDPGGGVFHTSSKSLVLWDSEAEIACAQVSSPQLWSPDKPVLYRCEVTLSGIHGSMTLVERFAFRYFEFADHGPFKLNGERLLLRGTHRVEDHAGLGAAMPEELTAKEVKMIKDLGANFLRLGHYQQSRIVLDLCDELGLLVWEEIPWSRGGLGAERYKQQARDMLRNLIQQHYNHASIIIWGLGNENDWPGDFPYFDKEQIRAFVRELNEQAHHLDPGRKTGLRRCDFCKDLVDVYSASIWAGWYAGAYTDYRDLLEKQRMSVPHFLQIEWGGDSHARRHSEEVDRLLGQAVSNGGQIGENSLLLTGDQTHAAVNGDWSETYLCNLLDWHLKEQESMPSLAGTAQWIFKDFSSPVRRTNPIPCVNQKGLVERDLLPKEAYYVVQSYWAKAPMVRIYGHSWPIRWGDPDGRKLIKVYSNCETVELFLNGVSCGVKSRRTLEFPAAGLRWLVNFQPRGNHLKAIGHKLGQTVVDEITLVYETQKWGTPARLDLRKKTNSGEVLTIEATLLDAHGALCLDARNVVRFQLAGDGNLIDDLGTSGGSRCLELYNGRAEINVRLNGGTCVATVSSKGIPTAFLLLEPNSNVLYRAEDKVSGEKRSVFTLGSK